MNDRTVPAFKFAYRGEKGCVHDFGKKLGKSVEFVSWGGMAFRIECAGAALRQAIEAARPTALA